MLELGEYTKEAHQQLGRKVSELPIDFLFTLGEEAPIVVESANRYGFPPERMRVVGSHSEAIDILRKIMQNGDWILIKGSRRMAMERIVEALIEGRA
jgi:UDP-N-acetylmuramoyl-tripeptide--D-alanyl-D-alanine ligase